MNKLKCYLCQIKNEIGDWNKWRIQRIGTGGTKAD